MRQLVPHVGERFLVHLFVLEDRPQRLRVLQQRMIVALEVRVGEWRRRSARRPPAA